MQYFKTLILEEADKFIFTLDDKVRKKFFEKAKQIRARYFEEKDEVINNW